MAINNYIATGTPLAGGEPTTGWLLTNGTDAYLVSDFSVLPDQGGISIEFASYTQVDPATVKLNSLNLQTVEISNLTKDNATIEVGADYDGIGSVTITGVKLETPAAFTPETASEAGTSDPIVATDDTAWGLASVTVNKVVTETKTFTPTLEGGTVNATGGKLMTAVTVDPVVLKDAGTVNPTTSEQTGTTVVPLEGALGYSNFKVGAIQVEEGTGAAAEGSSAEFEPTAGKYFSKFTVDPITIVGSNSATPSLSEQTLNAEGGYWKSFTVAATPLADNIVLTPGGSALDSDDLLAQPQYAGMIGIKHAIVNAVPLDENNTFDSNKQEDGVDHSAEEGKYFKSVHINPYVLNLQDKTVDPAESSAQVSADPTYDGLGTVTVNPINVLEAPVVAPSTEEQVQTANEGYWKQVTVSAIPTETKHVTPTTSPQTIEPTPGKYLTSVSVGGYTPNLTPLTVDPSEASQVKEVPQGYDGYSTVTVNPIQIDTVKDTYTPTLAGATINPDEGKYFKSFTVAGVPIKNGEADSSKELQTIKAEEGFFMEEVIINGYTPKTSPLTITPTESVQELEVPEGFDGYGTLTVNQIQIDSTRNTVKATKEDQTIVPEANKYFKQFTVEGYDLVLQEKSVDPSEAVQDIQPDEGYDGLSKVSVTAIQTESKSITATKEEQVVSPTSGKYLKSVTVEGYTPKVHPVEVAELKKGQVITTELGYDGISQVTIQDVKLQNKTINATKDQQVVTTDVEDSWGLEQVTVEGYVPNLQAKIVTELTTKTGTISADSTYDGLASVTINKVKLEDRTVDPTREGQTVNKTDEEAFGLNSVAINAVPLDEVITIDPSETEQSMTPTGFGYKGVKVTAIQIDENNSAEPTETDETYTPEEGKYFKQFSVSKINVMPDKTITPNDSVQEAIPDEKYYYKKVTVEAVPLDTSNNQATPSLEEQVINPEEGKYFKQFTVAVTPLAEAIEITPDDEQHVAELGEGNIGIKGATVNPVPVDSTTNSFTPTAEGTTVNATEGQYFKSFTVAPVPVEQISITPADEVQVIRPNEGKFFNQVTVGKDAEPILQTKTITPLVNGQTLVPDEGFEGFASVTINPVPLDEAITVQSGTEDEAHTPTGYGFKGVTVTGDENLVSANIKKGASILGVSGSYTGPEAGSTEAGFVAGEWVALDLPANVTRSENFRAAPYYKDHYLGLTFDGGDYLAITVFSRCGKTIATVLLNDIIGRYYIESVEAGIEIAPSTTLDLKENVDSSEIDWAVVSELKGNGHTIYVSETIEQDIEGNFIAEDVVFRGAGVVDNPFTGHSKSMTFNRCTFEGFESQALKSHKAVFNDCTFDGIEVSGKFLVNCMDSDVTFEGNLFRGSNGISVSGGTVAVKANTFETPETAIAFVGNVEDLDIEGNIFKSAGVQLMIGDSVTDVSTVHLIGDIELEGDEYKIVGNSLVPVEESQTPEGPTATEKAVKFFNELDQNAISSYMISNKDAVMKAFGVTEESSVADIGTVLYDKLQGGGTVTVSMNDGGKLNIHGHFYEPSDDLPYWDMYIDYLVPSSGTNKCFAEGSKMSVKGGSVTIHVTNGEMTSWGEFNMVLLIYGYIVDISNVTIEEGKESFVLNVTGLTRPNNYSKPCIIDPDSSTWEIHVREFYLPDAGATGTMTVDGKTVLWSDVKNQIK